MTLTTVLSCDVMTTTDTSTSEYVSINIVLLCNVCTQFNSRKPLKLPSQLCCPVYMQEGIWGGVQDNKLITARVQPGYVTCDSQGRLPGCRFKFDNQDAQCRSGRRGRCGLLS